MSVESADKNFERKREETKPTVRSKAAVDGTFREFVFTFREWLLWWLCCDPGQRSFTAGDTGHCGATAVMLVTIVVL